MKAAASGNQISIKRPLASNIPASSSSSSSDSSSSSSSSSSSLSSSSSSSSIVVPPGGLCEIHDPFSPPDLASLNLDDYRGIKEAIKQINEQIKFAKKIIEESTEMQNLRSKAACFITKEQVPSNDILIHKPSGQVISKTALLNWLRQSAQIKRAKADPFFQKAIDPISNKALNEKAISTIEKLTKKGDEFKYGGGSYEISAKIYQSYCIQINKILERINPINELLTFLKGKEREYIKAAERDHGWNKQYNIACYYLETSKTCPKKERKERKEAALGWYKTGKKNGAPISDEFEALDKAMIAAKEQATSTQANSSNESFFSASSSSSSSSSSSVTTYKSGTYQGMLNGDLVTRTFKQGEEHLIAEFLTNYPVLSPKFAAIERAKANINMRNASLVGKKEGIAPYLALQKYGSIKLAEVAAKYLQETSTNLASSNSDGDELDNDMKAHHTSKPVAPTAESAPTVSSSFSSSSHKSSSSSSHLSSSGWSRGFFNTMASNANTSRTSNAPSLSSSSSSYSPTKEERERLHDNANWIMQHALKVKQQMQSSAAAVTATPTSSLSFLSSSSFSSSSQSSPVYSMAKEITKEFNLCIIGGYLNPPSDIPNFSRLLSSKRDLIQKDEMLICVYNKGHERAPVANSKIQYYEEGVSKGHFTVKYYAMKKEIFDKAVTNPDSDKD